VVLSLKGIVLAGGAGTRLYPATLSVSKQILPIYDKPMIYYPISTLMLAGIRDILIISTPRDIGSFKDLLGCGAQFGMCFEYAVQAEPRGLADAFIVGKSFIGNDDVCLVLGDNIFYGFGFTGKLKKATVYKTGATIFGCYVSNPSDFGVLVFDEHNNPIAIEEKPQNPKSNYAVPGLYFYDNDVIDIATNIKPSPRGELEITAVNNAYLEAGKLQVELFGRGTTWLDTGTHSALLSAASFVETIQNRQGLYIACLEEIAFTNGYIDKTSLLSQADKMKNTDYGQYLIRIAGESVEGT